MEGSGEGGGEDREGEGCRGEGGSAEIARLRVLR